MAFFKFRKAGDDVAASPRQPESIEAMRRRARHRLIGAVVLVLAGVIGFPLLFDTQPRPVAVDIPIEIPDRNKVSPLPPLPPASVATAPAVDASAAQPASAPAAESKPEPAPAPVQKAETKPAPAEKKPDAKAAEAAKAQALLEGKSVSTGDADNGMRYVVQVGAFAEKGKAREAQQKLERAGLKNYTNVAE